MAIWLMLAIVCTGLLTGWLTGLSESPVTGVLLPLLFTLIASAGGFHFSNPEKAISVNITRVAQATFFFMIACGLGIAVGILQRAGKEPREKSAWQVDHLPSLPSAELIRVVAIEKKLMLLGVPSDVIHKFASKYADEFAANKAKHEKLLSDQDFDELERALQAVAKEFAATPTDTSHGTEFRERIGLYISHIQRIRAFAAKTGKRIPAARYAQFLNAVQSDNDAVIKAHEMPRISPEKTRLNFVPFYDLELVLTMQLEPLEENDRQTIAGDLSEDDIKLLDSSLAFITGTQKNEETPQRFSLKR